MKKNKVQPADDSNFLALCILQYTLPILYVYAFVMVILTIAVIFIAFTSDIRALTNLISLLPFWVPCCIGFTICKIYENPERAKHELVTKINFAELIKLLIEKLL